MKKEKNGVKATLLSLVMAAVLMLPMSLLAQKSDGFFKSSNNDVYNNRDTEGISLGMTLDNPTTEDPTAEAPLGSGLLIMTVAAAGYALARRKNAVRKGATMILALGLIMGMTQCKKNTVAPVSPASNGFNITVNANYGGDKTTFDPSGTFSWNGTEYINVSGKKSGYLGVLSGTNGTFSGTLSDPAADEEKLYFFYLGNGNHENATTLDFSNQDGSIGNVTNYHIAIGKADYAGETNYNTTLAMAMAIARFDLSGFTNSSDEPETVYVHGDDVYATATIDYNSGTISGGTKGYIKAGTASNSIYVALIPSVSSETTVKFDSNSKTGSMTFRNGIQASKYYCGSEHTALAVTSEAGSGIPGTFSVSATKKVFFSKGNLQYQASTGTWRFAENQYDYIGSAAGNTTNGDARATQSNWIDIFSWATSGYDNTANDEYAIRFQPYLATISTEVNSTYNQYGYGPSTNMNDKNLTGTSANYDWGVYNTISNGGTGWRTLTQGNGEGEWFYLLGLAGTPNPGTNCRSVNNTLSEQARYTMATIGGTYKGLIIFPDVYVHPDGTDFVAGTFNAKSDYTATVSVDGWKKMEAAGAVFLPAAGYRTFNVGITSPNAQGRYWSVNNYDKSQARYVYFSSSTFGAGYINRCYGCSVRLVKDVE